MTKRTTVASNTSEGDLNLRAACFAQRRYDACLFFAEIADPSEAKSVIAWTARCSGMHSSNTLLSRRQTSNTTLKLDSTEFYVSTFVLHREPVRLRTMPWWIFLTYIKSNEAKSRWRLESSTPGRHKRQTKFVRWTALSGPWTIILR